jgi:thymidylate synthase
MIDLHAYGDTLPMAWEESIIRLVEYGDRYPGRYWREGLPIGRGAYMIITSKNWGEEPRVHRGFTCTPEDLLAYQAEVCKGTDRKWEYTYHDRIFAYGPQRINQFEYAMQCLERKHDSNKAVITLGRPEDDCVRAGAGSHIPCLREIKWRLTSDNRLDTTLYWRSRDAINAAFNNLFALCKLTEMAAFELSMRLNRRVDIGQLSDITDCYHINGAHMHLAEKVVDMARARPYADRVWTSQDLRDMAHG